MHHYHGLAPRWYEMDYAVFLDDRRQRLSVVIREAYEALAGIAGGQSVDFSGSQAS
jgi:hypothetical protein